MALTDEQVIEPSPHLRAIRKATPDSTLRRIRAIRVRKMDVRLSLVHYAFDVVATPSDDITVIGIRYVHLHNDTIPLHT